DAAHRACANVPREAFEIEIKRQACRAYSAEQNFVMSEQRWAAQNHSNGLDSRLFSRIEVLTPAHPFSSWKKASDSDGEQGYSVGNLSLVGTRCSGAPRCRHAVPARRPIGRGICFRM